MEYLQERLRDDVAGNHQFESAKAEVLKTIAYTILKQVYGVADSQKVDVQEGVNFYDEVRRFEVSLIKQALFHTNGKQRAAASLLNLNATTLHAKIKFYGIEMPLVRESNDLSSELLSQPKRKLAAE